MAEQTGKPSAEPTGHSRLPGWGFWVWWVLASTVGWLIGTKVGPTLVLALLIDQARTVGGNGIGAIAVLSDLLFSHIGLGIIVLGGFMLGGAVFGVTQWLALRRQVAGAEWWVVASTIGWVVGRVASVAVGVLVGESAGWVLYGAIVGMLQWLVLRRKFARAGWWVVAGTVGVGMVGVLDEIVGGLVRGAVYGAITGAVLVWLLRQRAAEAER